MMATQMNNPREAAPPNGRRAPSLLTIVAVLSVLAVPAAAGMKGGGLFGRLKQKAPPPAPTVQFAHGVLKAGLGGQWQIGGQRIVFGPLSRVQLDGRLTDPSALREGMEVTVMGNALAGGLSASLCNVQPDEEPTRGLGGDDGVEWSTEDQTVGWGQRPN